jgi:hypothetical protein
MPIEHFTAGRKYTERRFIRQVGEPTEEDRQEAQRLWDALREAATLGHKLDTITVAATAQLKRSGLPYAPRDLLGPPYTEDWLRANRYRSLNWYAHRLLLSLLLWRERCEHGDTEAAMAECIALGAMFHEFCTVGAKVQEQSNAGKQPRQGISQRNEAWRARARELWAGHPTWGEPSVARVIAREWARDTAAEVSYETVRPVIRDLNPKKREK